MQNKMENIAAIKDQNLLDGTACLELIAEKYRGKHWIPGSLFYDEEIFGLIEPIFERTVDSYDHYEINHISTEQAKQLIKKLQSVSTELSSAKEFANTPQQIGFKFACSRDYFETNFVTAKNKTINMINELIEWLKKVLSNYDCITVAGI